jgi:thymidylate kinase
MKKIVVAIEGTDGAGKSSLARFLRDLCISHHQRCARIGRRSGFTSPTVARITNLLAHEGMNLTPQASVFLRVAREYQRAHLAASAGARIVVLDRFVLSALALARLNGQEPEILTPILKEIVLRADLHATIFVSCPFDVAWRRVQERTQGVPSSHTPSEALLRRMSGFLDEDFHRGTLTGQQWLVENSKDLADAQEQLARYLHPYLCPGEPSAEPAALMMGPEI